MTGFTARCVAALSLVCLVACSSSANSIPTSPSDPQIQSENMNPQLLSSSSELSFPQITEPVSPDALTGTSPYALPTSPPPTKLNSTWGRTGLGQIFDSRITASQATTDAHRYDYVWGSTIPTAWRAGNSKIFAGLYYILTDDNISYSGHNLAWWKANHPDWILYGCSASGVPSSTLIAWDAGVGYADVPLDIHNPAVVQYQLRNSAIPWAINHGYNALSIDQGLLNNPMLAGNPRLGQSVISGYYGCGVWSHGTFIKRYTSKTDPAWARDVINWLNTAHSILTTDTVIAPKHIVLSLNHPGGSLSNTNEQALLNAVDVVIDEVGFVDYGKYKLQANANLFGFTKYYALYAQAHGKGIVLIDRFVQSTSLTNAQIAYAIATYLMANQQGADLFITPNSYGSEVYLSKEAAVLGVPCGAAAVTDSLNPQIWYRKFNNGLAIVNSGSLPKTFEIAHPPIGHVYKDLFSGITLAPTIDINSNEAVLATTTNGCT
jgi:hypothetical protein